MIKLIEKRNWSEELLVPLTGLRKSGKFDQKSYLFWRDNSINDYKLMLTYSSSDEMLLHFKEVVFPALDKGGYLLESYDIGRGIVVLVLDMSDWAMDIEIFMKGRYSRLSGAAKKAIEDYHAVNKTVTVQLASVLYPQKSMSQLENMTPIEYVSKQYGLDISEMRKIGEVGSRFDEKLETLITE